MHRLLLISILCNPSILFADQPPKALPEAEALKKASVDGKYEQLLKKFKVEDDYKAYSEFRDWGRSTTVKYAGHADIPRGHWVYVYPHWYVWARDAAEQAAVQQAVAANVAMQNANVKGRNWGPEQATGPPDCPAAGDSAAAWATLQQNDVDEWLDVGFKKAVRPAEIHIHENFNPGAVYKITGYTEDGDEHDLWEGKDPTPMGKPNGVSKIKINKPVVIQRIRIYLNCDKVEGWNEIDAVGLVGPDNKKQWATDALASSTYADVGQPNAVSNQQKQQHEKQMAKMVKKLRAVEKKLKAAKMQLERNAVTIARLEKENNELRARIEN